MISAGGKYFILVGLLLLLWAAAALAPPYLPSGPSLLPVTGPCDDSSGWIVHPGSGRILCQDDSILFTAPDTSGFSRVQFSAPGLDAGTTYLLLATARSQEVRPGARSWQRARMVFAQYDAAGHWLPTPSDLFSLSGSQGWRSYRGVFRVRSDAARALISLGLERAGGLLEVRQLGLFYARPSRLYPWVQKGGWLVAGLLFSSLMLPYLKRPLSLPFRCFLLVVLGALLTGALLPGGQKLLLYQQLENAVGTLVLALGCGMPWPFELGKTGHFILFGLLAAGMFKLTGGQRPIRLLLDLVLFAAGTELLQAFIPGRTASVEDFLLDLIGGLCALTLVDSWRQFSGLATRR